MLVKTEGLESASLGEISGRLFPEKGHVEIIADSSPLHDDPFIPRFDVLLDDQKIGYISRGHVLLYPDFQGKGYYSRALGQLEQFERELFREGWYPEYKKRIAEELSSYSNVLEQLFCRLNNPHHVDFWRNPLVAARLVENGYKLDWLSVQYLVVHNLAPDISQESILKALRKTPEKLARGMLCILSKEAEL